MVRIPMNTFAISQRLCIAALISGGISSGATAGLLDDTEFRLDMELRATVVFEDAPFDNDDSTSFFDQYRYVATENDRIPWHIDFRRLELAYEREDGTRPLYLERESLGWLNERGEIGLVSDSIRAKVHYSRYRSAEMRLFPVGTAKFLPAAPTFGSLFSTDLPASAPKGEDHRLFSRRNAVGAEVGNRRESNSRGWLVPIEGSFFVDFQKRGGKQQDRFLIEDLGLASANQRFRERTRTLDQEFVTAGGKATFISRQRFTTTGEFRYEGFRERAPTVTYGTLANETGALPIANDPLVDSRAYRFVPDSDRFTVSMASAGRVGKASLGLAGDFTHLRQAGQGAPLQRMLGLGDVEVNSGSIRGTYKIPIGRIFDLSGHVRAQWRRNEIDRGTISALALSGIQTNALIRERREISSNADFRLKPMAGSMILAGLSVRDIDRDLKFGSSVSAISDSINLIESTTREFRVYIRGAQRVGTRMRVSAEAGYEWAPQVALVRDAEEAFFAKAGFNATISIPVLATLDLHGRYRRTRNDEMEFRTPALNQSRKKEFKQEEWSYGVTITMIAWHDIQLIGSFVNSRDNEEIDHIRSNLPRNSGDPALEFFRDSRLDYRSDLKNVALSTTIPIAFGFEGRSSLSISWVDAGFPGASNTERVLDSTNRIRQRILSTETGLAWTHGSWRVEVAYRFDDFNDDADLEALQRDVSAHSGWLSIGFRI